MNATTNSDRNPSLMIAVANRNFSQVQHLIETWPEQLHMKDQKGANALLHCCASGSIEIFKYLVQNGLETATKSNQGETCLMIAAGKNNFSMVQHLVETYPGQLDEKDQQGLNAVLHCCDSGSIEIFKYLVQNGMDTATKSNLGRTCLMNAAYNNNFSMVQHLVETYPSQLDEKNQKGANALLHCCASGSIEIFQYLVQNGLDTATKSNQGITCLMNAAGNNNFRMVQHLVETYPSQLDEKDQQGLNALLHCCDSGSIEIFKYLVQNGMDTATKSNQGETCLMIAAGKNNFSMVQHLVETYPGQLDEKNQKGANALLYCCANGSIEIFQYLVQNGLDTATKSNQGVTCLMIAAGKNNFSMVQHLVETYPSQLDEKNQKGANALIYCCAYGSIEIFKYLVQNGLDTATKSNQGITCLMDAAYKNNFSMVQHLVETYPGQLDEKDQQGLNALLHCCASGSIEIFKYLVQNGLDTATKSNQGVTCLMNAAGKKNFSMVQHLVETYPSQLDEKSQNGLNALLHCCAYGSIEIFKYLVQNGMDTATKSNQGVTCLMIAAGKNNFSMVQHLVETYPGQLDEKNQKGENALLYCCVNGSIEIFQYLVQNGLDTATKSNQGETCLMDAAYKNNFSMVQHLVETYPSQLDEKDQQGLNALLHCCASGSIEIFKYLVQNGLDTATKSNQGVTCLMNAAGKKNFSMVQHLVETYPSQLDEKSQNGLNALLHCCAYGSIEIFKYLVQNGMDTATKSNQGVTCLMIAAGKNNFSMVQHLVETYPGQLDEKNQKGANALLYCCVNGSIEIFQYLVQNGLDTATKSNQGETCLMDAAYKNNFSMVQHLVETYPSQLDEKDQQGLNALLHCCASGSIEIFKYLVQNGLDTATKSNQGVTCLMNAAGKKNFSMVQHLVETYPGQLDEKNQQGLNALLHCCASGSIEIFKYLVQNGLDTATKSNQGVTCLMNAAGKKNFSMVQHLVETYPSQLDEKSQNGLNALLHCCAYGSIEIFKYLVQNGMDTATKSNQGVTCLMIAAGNNNFSMVQHLVETYPGQLDEKDQQGLNALLHCCASGSIEIFKYLVQNGMDTATKSNQGVTCLMIAAGKNNFSMVQHLVETYPGQLDEKNQKGENALLYCCVNGSIEIFQYLVQNGLDTATKSNQGETCLMDAAGHNNFSMVQHLVETYPSQLDEKDLKGSNALLHCCANGSIEIFQYLVQNGLDTATKLNQGITCLMIAACNNNFSMVQHLVETYPGQLDEKDQQGLNALLHCCAYGSIEIFKYLGQNGMDTATKSNQGVTCLMIAAGKNNFSMVQHLVETYPSQLDEKYQKVWDALLFCCASGSIEIFKYLVQNGIDTATTTHQERNIQLN
ncbi:ankyrin-3-like [Mizuhopecten yessoensis]|uniref:ankyrin-3-like n=1 Tax=Mizuhopecten yessoensis TaxID=6573 RepID=UPI000B457D31|nr:ankyrin-3-like [Mizuhopecten yessoensis]